MQSLYLKAFNYIDNSKPSNVGIYSSLLLHLLIVLFAIGLPDLFKPKEISVPQIIPIEILNVTDVTSLTPKKDNLDISKKDTKKKIEQKKFNSSENTEIQKIDLQQKPKKIVSKNNNKIDDALIRKKNEQKNITIKEKKINDLNKSEEIETLKEDKIKPKLKPKPKPIDKIETNSDIIVKNKTKQIANYDKKNMIEEKPVPIEKPKPEFNIASVLKDLRNEEVNTIQEEKPKEKNEKESDGEEKEIVDNTELQITLANLAMQQLQGCVSIDSGQLKGNYQDFGPQFIKTRAKYDKEGKVVENSIQIVDINISNKINKMIQSRVIFALNTCNLDLPIEHYELWKSITMVFDVDKMLNK